MWGWKFLVFHEEKTLTFLGVEKNTTALEICAKKKLKVYNSLESLPNKAFDIISLWHVLEHLPQPEKVIAKIYDLFDCKGVLIVAVPNFSSHDRLHYKNNWAALDVPRHLWHFTPDGFGKNVFQCWV